MSESQSEKLDEKVQLDYNGQNYFANACCVEDIIVRQISSQSEVEDYLENSLASDDLKQI